LGIKNFSIEDIFKYLITGFWGYFILTLCIVNGSQNKLVTTIDDDNV